VREKVAGCDDGRVGERVGEGEAMFIRIADCRWEKEVMEVGNGKGLWDGSGNGGRGKKKERVGRKRNR